jgi:hypothetical protein
MIKVYIETGSHAECVATIQDEWVYMALVPALEKLALEWGGILTESVFEDTPKPEPITKVHILMCSVKHDFHDNGTILKVFDTESKALAHMEELEIYDKVTDSEMYDYWIKEHNIEQDGTIQH